MTNHIWWGSLEKELQFRTLEGKIIASTDDDLWLKIEHVLQRYRDVWVPTEDFPYLSIDQMLVNKYCAAVNDFVVFSSAQLYQNIRKEELGHRMISMLAGPGITAGFSPSGKVFVEGIANLRANCLMFFNDPFLVGMHPFSALNTHYICVDENHIYQRKFGDLIVMDKYSRPDSPYVDFSPLAILTKQFHCEYLNGLRDQPKDIQGLAMLLDKIFVENLKIHEAAKVHHDEAIPHERIFNYDAPRLTKYGRLTHDDVGAPQVEVSFVLLHYEKAIREFNAIKVAQQMGNTDAAFLHGVYCIVAAAACIEAIANKLVLMATSIHPDRKDKRQPVEKINDAASALAANYGRIFKPLIQGQATYEVLNKLRVARNSFMHAKELETDIDSSTLTSVVVASVEEFVCKDYLKQLRLAVVHVYEQLPEYASPIVTKDNVKWLGDLEVP